jgi:hypothetical protein
VEGLRGGDRRRWFGMLRPRKNQVNAVLGSFGQEVATGPPDGHKVRGHRLQQVLDDSPVSQVALVQFISVLEGQEGRGRVWRLGLEKQTESTNSNRFCFSLAQGPRLSGRA